MMPQEYLLQAQHSLMKLRHVRNLIYNDLQKITNSQLETVLSRKTLEPTKSEAEDDLTTLHVVFMASLFRRNFPVA